MQKVESKSSKFPNRFIVAAALLLFSVIYIERDLFSIGCDCACGCRSWRCILVPDSILRSYFYGYVWEESGRTDSRWLVRHGTNFVEFRSSNNTEKYKLQPEVGETQPFQLTVSRIKFAYEKAKTHVKKFCNCEYSDSVFNLFYQGKLVRGIVITNPGNPLGTILLESELMEILQFAAEYEHITYFAVVLASILDTNCTSFWTKFTLCRCSPKTVCSNQFWPLIEFRIQQGHFGYGDSVKILAWQDCELHLSTLKTSKSVP